MAETRYELVRIDRTARFCPVVGDVVGFATATGAMLYLFEHMPNEALLWDWAPVWNDTQADGEERARL